ncbi:hypothetical protein ACRAWD_30290 [Caulobacter segnis]
MTFDDTAKETNVSWRLGAPQYQLAQRTMGYATVSRGYKGPGFNQTGVSNATTTPGGRSRSRPATSWA